MIAIKDMEMPRSCFCCPFSKKGSILDGGYFCILQILDNEISTYVKSQYKINGEFKDKQGCPLVEIEQSEDCVSRQVVLDLMQLKMGGNELYKAVYELPPVIPTHKTCKECKEWINDKKYPRCRDFGVALNEDFYCADFKRKE